MKNKSKERDVFDWIEQWQIDLFMQPFDGTIGKYTDIHIKLQSNILYFSGLANYLFNWILGNRMIIAIYSRCFWNENNRIYYYFLHVGWVCIDQNQLQTKTSLAGNSPEHTDINQFVMGILKDFGIHVREWLFYII